MCPACPEAVAPLRREVADLLTLWKQQGLADDVCLCLAELLANVIKHAGSSVCVLAVQEVGTGVRITVSDGCPRLPEAQESDPFAESRRGMQLIAATASAFGSTPTASGKDVWAEFRARGIGDSA